MPPSPVTAVPLQPWSLASLGLLMVLLVMKVGRPKDRQAGGALPCGRCACTSVPGSGVAPLGVPIPALLAQAQSLIATNWTSYSLSQPGLRH